MEHSENEQIAIFHTFMSELVNFRLNKSFKILDQKLSFRHKNDFLFQNWASVSKISFSVTIQAFNLNDINIIIYYIFYYHFIQKRPKSRRTISKSALEISAIKRQTFFSSQRDNPKTRKIRKNRKNFAKIRRIQQLREARIPQK